jgi:hypothetical protein
VYTHCQLARSLVNTFASLPVEFCTLNQGAAVVRCNREDIS